MSFQFNSDREQIRGVDSTIIGSGSVRIRSGSGIEEREIFQAKVDATSGLPRVGINRTGRRVDSITVLTAGTGYTSQPSVNISPPTLPGGIQAIASASTDQFGRITGIQIDNPGDGYEFPPSVNIEGGGGVGGTAQSFLDTIDFELDVNGAIRTSTSIISDTANILNLDINNLVTPDLKIRGADLKTWMNASGTRFPLNVEVNKDDYYWEGNNVYQILNNGVTATIPPFHTDGIELNGEVNVKHIGFRVNSPNLPFYGETGESGLFPRSITPLLGDRSDKIATTEYVLNLATNDVGGRIYVSEQIGKDTNDGRSPVNPVRTIKRACQLAWETPGVKESIIVAGGNYEEDNPISIPPDASVVGDNLRLVIIRPINTGKHIFKFGDKNYVIGVTYQDKVNAAGGSVGTWDFAMVFDDKQRITYDIAANGDFGIDFPVGHQFFGNESFTAGFTNNLVGLDQLTAGIEIFGVNSGATGVIGEVVFDISDPLAVDDEGNATAFKTGRLNNIVRTAGNSFNNSESFFYGGTGSTKWKPQRAYELGDIVWTDAVLGDQSLTGYVYTVTVAGTSGTSAPTHGSGVDTNGTVELTFLRGVYIFSGNDLKSTTPEGEVVFTSKEYEISDDLPIQLIDFTKEGTFNDGFQSEIYGSSEDLGGIVFYTNQLDGSANIHDFQEGEEIEISGMPTAGPDLSFFNGKHRIYKVLEDADGRSRRFVLPKKVPASLNLSTESEWDPGTVGATPSVRTFSKSVTMSLLNSPNKFPIASPVARRYQDACSQIRNNIDFIADEVVRRINDEFKQEYFFAYDIGAGGGNDFKIYLGTSRFAHTYVSGGTVTAGGNTYNVTNFTYDHTLTGEATITLDSAPAFAEDDTILLADLVVSCIIDGVVTQKVYPSFNIPVNDQKCRRDIGHFLNALIQDLEFGSNYNIINAAKRYFGSGQIEYVDYEIIQTVRAIEYARELAIYAMRKWRTGTGLPGEAVYVPQYSTIDLYIDPTVIDDVAATACANVASAITTLSYLFVDVVANNSSGTYLDAAYLIARNRHHIADEAYYRTKQQYPSLSLNNVDERKCRRDINYVLNGVLRDLVLGGNTGVVNAAEFYYSGTALAGVPQSELGPTRYAFQKTRDLSIQAMRNWKTSTGSPVTANFTIIPQFTDSSILVDADGTPTAQLTPIGATYDPATGDFVMTFGSPHGVTTNESIRLEIESFVFTCAMDNYRSEHYLPESDQPAATSLLPITAVTTNTITVNVGASGANESFTPTNATYNPATGEFTMEIGSHSLSLGEGIVLDDNSFTFTCDMDGNDAQKTYPRPGIDPFAGRSMKITSSTETSITVNVGASGPNKYFTPTAATYDPTTGDMTVTVGQHGLGVGRGVVLEDNSFTFTCALDGNQSQETYPRPGTDPYAGKSIAITSVGSTLHSPSNASYDPAAGTLEFTLIGHGFSNGDYIKIDDNAITFTCDLDGNATQHTYPRPYEYASGRWFAVQVVDADTLQITGLPIPRDQSTHTYVSFAPNSVQRQDGTFTINVGTSSDTSVHTFVSATTNAIKHEPQSTHTFVSATTGAVKHLPQSTHQFERVTGTNVVAAYPSGGSAPCANVEATLTSSFALLDGILEFAADPDSPTAIQPGTTTRTTGTLYTADDIISYPSNVLRDAKGNYVTIRAVYDDLPIISASPYTQNASIISKAGGSGALIDGSKVKNPNCPFPGLADGKAIFPNQGKSMVASAFTIVSEKNGTGYKIIEDGYVQLVSVFCIFTVDGILAESGGYASVTNSASNFGKFALRATGYRREAYSFDAGYESDNGYVRARIDAVTTAVNGLTELTVQNLGRAPLEHYIVKVDGYETRDPDLEYFINNVELITDGVPYRARIQITDGTGGTEAKFRDSATKANVAPSVLQGKDIALHRPSIVNSSSHTFEFVGSGTDYEGLPENGGIKRGNQEQVSENYGRVYASGTDELGDFKVGDFVIIENRTGNIQFKGTVSISEVDFLKLSGGDVTITGFSKLNTLGGNDADDETLPTQKAVRDFVVNNLGQYIGKGFTTNRVPRNLVELNDQGLISESQLPTTSPIEVYSVANETEQLALEGVRAGDIAVVDGEAFILNTDSDSLFLGIPVNTSQQFTVNDIFTGSITGGKIQLTEYRFGVIKSITIPEGGGGSGYSTSNPPTVVITDDGTSLGHVPAVAEAVVAGGEVVAINLVLSNSIVGGQGYIGVPTISFTNTSGGSGAQATAAIESRLYGDIVNSIKIGANDTIQSSDVPAETVDVDRVVNTSASNIDNWVSLNTGTISASAIVDGPIPTEILANNSESANSNTFLSGDQTYKKVVKSFRNIETRYFLRTATDSSSDTILFEVSSENNTQAFVVGHSVVNTTGVQPGTTITQVTSVTVGVTNYVRITLSDGLTSTVPAGTIVEFERPESPVKVSSLLRTIGSVDQVLIINGGTGFAADATPVAGNKVYGNIEVTGGSEGTGLRLDITVSGGVVTNVAIANPGTGFTGDFQVDTPSEIGTGGSGLILQAKVQQEPKLEGDITIDVDRATSDTLSSDDYGTVGVVRLKKSQFTIGDNGAVLLNTGLDSGLDADLLDGFQGEDYRNASKISSGVLGRPYLEGTYDIKITQESGSTGVLTAKTGSLTDDKNPGDVLAGATVEVRRNDADNLLDPPTVPGSSPPQSTASEYHTILSVRGGGTGTTNQYGGVVQLAFTNGNNVYLRGSSGNVASDQTWSSWGKVWNSQNDYRVDPANTGEVAGPNAYRLRNRTGLWYQNAHSFIFGSLSDRRIPSYFTQKDVNTRLRILEDTGTGKRYDIYISEVTASTIAAFDNAPFVSNPRDVKLLTASGDDPGVIRVTNIAVYNIQGEEIDTTQTISDYTALYAIVTGTMSSGGNFTFTDSAGDTFPAEFLGDDTVQIPFSDYGLSAYDANNDGMPDGNVEAIRLESVAGESFLIMGREDGQQGSETTPQIWFRSSSNTPTDTSLWYNSGFKASGGNDNNGSGQIDVLVTSPNAFTIGSNIVWNAGNTLITATNTGSTYTTTAGVSNFDANFPDNEVSLRSLVMRDENGDFDAGTITANLTGTASGNLPIGGGTLTGGLTIGNSNNDASLVVYGPTTLNGSLSVVTSDFVVDTNVLVVNSTDDRVGIGQPSPSVKLDVYQRTNTTGSGGTTLLKLTNDVRDFQQVPVGDIEQQRTFIDFAFIDDNDNGTPQVRIGAQVGPNSDADSSTKEGSGAFVVYTGTGTSATTNDLTEKLRVSYNGNVGVNNNDPTYKLDVTGNIRSTTNIQANQSVTIGEVDNNNGAPIYFNGATGGATANPNEYLSNFRIGNQLTTDDVFEITAIDHGAVNTPWKTPALAIKGSSNRIAINTLSFSGTDTSGETPIERNYNLNVQGDVNFNGQLFQNNEEFVTSRWTEAANEIDIYRLSKVGIGPSSQQVTQPGSELVVGGNIALYSGEIVGDPTLTGGSQWFSAGYFGVDRDYPVNKSETYGRVRYRRVNQGVYYWWVLIVRQNPSDATLYTPVFGALIATPPGGTTGEILEARFDEAVSTFGNPNVGATTEGNHYLGWLSTAPGYTAPTGSIYADSSAGGKIDYVATSTAPTTSVSYDVATVDSGTSIHIQLIPESSILSSNGDKQWLDSYGLIKRNRKNIVENIVIGSNDNCMSTGSLNIEDNKVVTIEAGGVWTIV